MEDPSDEEGGMLTIPFQFSGVTSYFPVRKPTKAEWEDDSMTKIELTAEIQCGIQQVQILLKSKLIL